MQENKIVNNTSEYVAAISALSQSVAAACGNDYSLLFRGQSDDRNILLPSIGRQCSGMIGEPLMCEERNMIEMAKYKLPDLFPSTLQPIDLLALLQHHGIPTRLLDISENALVALYFACSSESDREQDGEVLIFNHRNNNIGNYPMINAIADSYRFIRSGKTPLSYFYRQAIKQSYFSEQLTPIGIDDDPDQAGVRWVSDCCKDIMLIYAKSYGLRQRIQRGRYILFPNTIEAAEDGSECFVQSITPIPKTHKAIIGHYTIPAASKQRILEELQLLGISKEMLFLDNADIVCKEISERVKSSHLR